MILNQRAVKEERFIRKIMVLVRTSKDSGIETQQDVSDYIGSMFHDLDFEERRDIVLAWMRLRSNPLLMLKDLFMEIASLLLPDKEISIKVS